MSIENLNQTNKEDLNSFFEIGDITKITKNIIDFSEKNIFNSDKNNKEKLLETYKAIDGIDYLKFHTEFKKTPGEVVSLLSDIYVSGFISDELDRSLVYMNIDSNILDDKDLFPSIDGFPIEKQIAGINLLQELTQEYDGIGPSDNFLNLLDNIKEKTNSPLLRYIAEYNLLYLDGVQNSMAKIEFIGMEVSELKQAIYSSSNPKEIKNEIEKKEYEVIELNSKRELSFGGYNQIQQNAKKGLDDFCDSGLSQVKSIKKFKSSKDYYSFGTLKGGSIGLTTENDEILSYENFVDKKDINLIKILHNPINSSILNEKLGIELENMYLDEQVQFLKYLSGTKTKKWNQLEGILKNKEINSENILKSFLSLDKSGPEMGQKILDIGEKLPAESANAIFAKYAELAETTKGIEDFMKEEFSEEISENPEVVEQVKEKLLNKGVALLNLFHGRIDDFDEETKPNAVEVIEAELSKISADVIATLSTFKFARKNGFDLSLEDIKNSEFKNRSIEEISESEREEMIQIYRENYVDNPRLAEELIGKFENAFIQEKNLHNSFYIYKIGGKIDAFCRFKDFKDGRHLSAVNVRSDAKGYALGQGMIEKSIEIESSDNILYAEADFSKQACYRFLETGFVADKELDIVDIEAVSIVYDKDTEYLSKSYSQSDIASGKIEESNELFVETYNDIKDFDRSRLGELVVTRSFYHNENQKYYVVLEKKKTQI